MKLKTMSDLDGVLKQKSVQREALLEKLDLLLKDNKVEISYSLELTQQEQINLAKSGIYSLTYDLLYYERNYDDSSI